MQENNPIIASVKPKRGRKIKHVVNSYGKYECKTCSKSYNNKQCLFQHTRLKHSNPPTAQCATNPSAPPTPLTIEITDRGAFIIPDRGDNLLELVKAKTKTHEAMLNMFQVFIERVSQQADEYMSALKSFCNETNNILSNVGSLSKLTI